MGRLTGSALVGLAVLASAPCASAQCPDGTPLPCAGARRPAPRPAAPAPAVRARTFLLLPFRNVTRGDAQEWLTGGAPLMLASALGQFRDLTVVSDERLLAARRRMGLAPDAAADAAQLRRLAEETGGWTAVVGTVMASGGRLRIAAQALDAVTGNVLVRAEVEAVADGDVRPAFDTLAVRLLEVAGLPPAASDVAALTTRSLDAYRAYVRGVGFLQQSAYTRARDALREAVRLDSTFALAWVRLAIAGSAWNLAELLNPYSLTYAAAARAAALASRLPPRQAAQVRLLSSALRGRLAVARALGDSLARTDPDDLDTREFLSLFESSDPTLDTLAIPPRLRASPNRAVGYARDVLEKDPGRRSVYAVMGYTYGLAGGLWWGQRYGMRREATSYGAAVSGASDGSFVPVLRDTFELLASGVFGALPEAERSALRRRATDAGMQWMERWLAAGPGDADAHLWTSRFAEMQGDLPRALRELDVADSLGVESRMEGTPGRRVMLLVRLGRVAQAGVLADSLARTGALRTPLVASMDRGLSYGAAALLLTRRFARAAALATAAGPSLFGVDRCRPLMADLIDEGTTTSWPAAIGSAVADTITAHAGAFAAQPVLRPCLEIAVWARGRRFGPRTGTAARLLAVADSLAAAGDTAGGLLAGVSAWRSDSSVAALLRQRPWFTETERALAIGRRFRPVSAVVEGDSVLLTWELAEPGAFRWDVLGTGASWFVQVFFGAQGASGAPAYVVYAGHRGRVQSAAASGGLADLVASIDDRGVSATQGTDALREASGAVVGTDTGFRVVVRGDLARALRLLRPPAAVFTYRPCLRWETNARGCPVTPVPLTIR